MKNKCLQFVAVENEGFRWIVKIRKSFAESEKDINTLNQFAKRCSCVSRSANTTNRELVEAWDFDEATASEIIKEIMYCYLPLFNISPVVGFELWVINCRKTSVASLKVPFLGR